MTFAKVDLVLDGIKGALLKVTALTTLTTSVLRYYLFSLSNNLLLMVPASKTGLVTSKNV